MKNRTRFLPILGILALAFLQSLECSAAESPAAITHPPLIPMPAKIEWREGVFAASGPVQINRVAGLPAEGYEIEVTATGALVRASTDAGAFYAAETLKQLRAADGSLPCVSIRDEPRVAWRGFMLDVSRHFFDKAEIKAVLDRMAVLKLNVFHWHLTDDHGWRIEIKKYPKLTTVGAWHPASPADKKSRYVVDGLYGGFYTQEEIREVIAYAAERHIRIVPEVDMPGHMSAAAASYPELSPDNGWTPVVARQEGRGKWGRCAALCVARPQTVQFCKDVLDEVIALFPSKEIHVGGDEVFYEQWEPCPDMQAMKKKLGAKAWEEVQVSFGNEMAAHVRARGRTAIFWNNIYRQTADKGGINQFWRNMNNARTFAEAGYEVVLSPYQYYFAQPATLEKVYHYDPLAIVGVKPEAQARIRGIEGCAWSEHFVTFAELERFIYPRIVAIAETAWTPQESLDWGSFEKRLAHASFTPAVTDQIRDRP